MGAPIIFHLNRTLLRRATVLKCRLLAMLRYIVPTAASARNIYHYAGRKQLATIRQVLAEPTGRLGTDAVGNVMRHFDRNAQDPILHMKESNYRLIILNRQKLTLDMIRYLAPKYYV